MRSISSHWIIKALSPKNRFSCFCIFWNFKICTFRCIRSYLCKHIRKPYFDAYVHAFFQKFQYHKDLSPGQRLKSWLFNVTQNLKALCPGHKASSFSLWIHLIGLKALWTNKNKYLIFVLCGYFVFKRGMWIGNTSRS